VALSWIVDRQHQAIDQGVAISQCTGEVRCERRDAALPWQVVAHHRDTPYQRIRADLRFGGSSRCGRYGGSSVLKGSQVVEHVNERGIAISSEAEGGPAKSTHASGARSADKDRPKRAESLDES
jgi:hypothetical protein